MMEILGQFEFEEEEVLGSWKSIKKDKSPGPNGIYPTLLRGAREGIVGSLMKIFSSYRLGPRGLEGS